MSLENDLISMPSDRRNIDRNYVKLGLIKLLGCLAALCVCVCWTKTHYDHRERISNEMLRPFGSLSYASHS